MTDLLKKIGKIVVISIISLILIATILYLLLLNLHRYKNSSNERADAEKDHMGLTKRNTD